MRLTPRNLIFYELFTTTAGNIETAADVLSALIHAEPADRAELATQLKELEHRGDDLTHDILGELNTSFITPFDREDIAFLAARLDDVIDELEEAGALIVLYRLNRVPAGVEEQVALLQQAAQVTAAAMPRLRTLTKLADYWIMINEIENQADVVHRGMLAELFETVADPLMVIKMKDVLEQLESAADAFERVANVIQSIAAKES